MIKQIKRHRAIKNLCFRLLIILFVGVMGVTVGKLIVERGIEVNKEQPLPFITAEMSEEEEKRCFYYSLLNENEQEAYRAILAGVRAGQEEIYVHLADPARCTDIYRDVYLDHPEFFWCDGSSRATSYTSPGVYSVIVPGYTVKGEEREVRRKQIEREAEAWLAQIPEELSEYEKIKMVYEMMIDAVEYKDQASDNQNIYSVFVNRQSVCAGYARATQYLLNRLGIFCTYVTGEVYTGASHAWNIVRCGGEYYHVDTTWGDPVFLQDESELVITAEEVTYDYLCCPDSELFKTHTPTPDIGYPECTASEYEYYRRNGMYYETADADVLGTVMQKSIEEKQDKVIFKFRDDKVYEEAHAILFGGLLEKQAQYLGRWYDLDQIYYYYREEPKLDKITVYWKYE